MKYGLIISSVVVAVLSIWIYLIPSPLDPRPHVFEKPPTLVGALEANTVLENVVKAFEGKIIGPESFAGDNEGNLYTGTWDGKIWKISTDGFASVLARTGIDHPDCGRSYDLEPLCGRVKGMKVDKNGDLFAVDCYKGLFKIHLPSGEIENILAEGNGVDGKSFTFLNSLDISDDGIVYFSESSSKWTRRDAKLEVIETNNFGRILAYDPVKNSSWTVADELYMANGIALSPDNSFLLINEMNRNRITRLYLKGPKTGMREIFLDNVPGYPDNIKLTPHGTYYIGLLVTRFSSTTGLKKYTRPFLDLIAPYPAIKRFIAKVTPMFVYNVFLPAHSYFIEVDSNGNIINSFHDPSGLVIKGGMTEAFLYNGKVYLGHHETPFIGVLDAQHVLN
ncbi:adipocyte plasma membrane-associated protein-like [Tubulanus polymorphus]|uniref:adipocyte plasma membrane-associated protein-like n=1 Tax=Tubulanus polymorphus TaxID=672921 RepID=UPI003DA49DC8